MSFSEKQMGLEDREKRGKYFLFVFHVSLKLSLRAYRCQVPNEYFTLKSLKMFLGSGFFHCSDINRPLWHGNYLLQ